jgi:tetratricopeptide (TPR) repeat protein
MGWTKVYLGDMDGAIEQLEVALRVNPLDPRRYTTLTAMAYAYFFAGRNDQASALASDVVRQQANYLAAQRLMMACHAMAGAIDEARRACAVAMRIDPTQRISVSNARAPFRRPQDVEKLTQAASRECRNDAALFPGRSAAGRSSRPGALQSRGRNESLSLIRSRFCEAALRRATP